MNQKPSTWKDIESDPEYQLLKAASPIAAEEIRKQYVTQAKATASGAPAPRPHVDPSIKAQMAESRSRRVNYGAIPQQQSAADIIKEHGAEGFKQTTTGALGDKAIRDAKASMPAKSKTIAEQMADSQARRVDYETLLAPKPTLRQQVDAVKQEAGDTLTGLQQNISTGSEGVGEGLLGLSANMAGQMVDPAGAALDVVGGAAANKLVAKGLSQKVARPVTALASGAAQGAATSLAEADPQSIASNTLLSAGLSALTAGKVDAPKVARLQEALTLVKNPKAKAKLEARIAELAPQVAPEAPAPKPDNIVPFPGPKTQPAPASPAATVARLVGDEAGSFNPKALADAVTPTFRQLIADESGQFDLDGFMRGLAKNVNDLRKKGDALVEDGRIQEGQAAHAQATALQDVRTIATERPAQQTPAANVDATRYANPSKWDFASNDAILKFDDLTRQVVAERGWDPKQVIGHADIDAAAQELLGEPARVDALKDRKLKPGQSLSAVEYRAATLTVKNLVEESTALEQRIATLPSHTAPEVRQQMAVQLDRLERDIKGFMDVVIPSRSQKGRDLNYLKMVAQQSFSPDYWLARAYRVSGALGHHALSDINQILVRGNAAQAAGDAAGTRAAKIDLAKAMSKLERTGHLEAISALRKAGLLTGVKTIARNMAGTWAYQGLEEVAKMPAWMIDWAIGNAPLVGTGQRTVAAPTPGKMIAGLRAASTVGVREFGEVMVHGLPLDQLANLELNKEINTGFAPLDVYANTIFRFQSAQDRLAKAYAMKRSILDQAQLAAINERQPGQTRAQLQAVAQHYAANPTDEMILEAIADADFATFTNDTPLSKGVAKFQSGLPPRMKFAFDLVLPFKKTPLAVADRILKYAVIGEVGEIANPHNYVQVIRDGLSPAQQKSISLGMGRGLVGSSIIAMGYWLAQNNQMTAGYDPDTAAVDQAAGRTPASLKVAGSWIPVQPLSPIGNLLTLGASLAKMQRAGLNAADAPGATVALAAKTVLDQPMTQGAAQIVDLARDPEKSLPKFGASLAGSVVPSLAGEIAQSVDSVERDVSKEWPQAGSDAIQKKAFGHRLDLPAKLTPLGDTIPVPSGPNAFNAFAGRRAIEETDPVVRELVTHNPKIPMTPKTLKDRGDTLTLTPDMKREFQERAGTIARITISGLLRDPEYTEEADPEVKTKLLEDAFADGRQRAKEAMMDQYQDQVTPEDDE